MCDGNATTIAMTMFMVRGTDVFSSDAVIAAN